MSDAWRLMRLGDVIRPDISKVDVVPGHPLDLAGVYSFGRGLFRRDPLLAEKTSYKQMNVLRSGQLVMSKLKAWEGAVSVIGPAFDGAVLSQEFPTFTVEDGVCTTEFLELLCSLESFWELLATTKTGMGGRKERVNPTKILELVVPIPPLYEQRRIVDAMRAVDAAADAALVVASAASTAWRAEMARALDTATQSGTLEEMAQVDMGRQRSPRHSTGSDITSYLRAANVKDGELRLDDVLQMNFTPTEQVKYRLQSGDVLVTEGCGSRSQVGASAQWNETDAETVCFQNTLLRLRPKPGESIPAFLHHFARYAHVAGLWAAIASGSNIFHIGSTRAKLLMVPRLSIDEQEDLSETLDRLDAVQARARALRAAMIGLRKSMLADLMTGKHRIPDTYDELLETAS